MRVFFSLGLLISSFLIYFFFSQYQRTYDLKWNGQGFDFQKQESFESALQRLKSLSLKWQASKLGKTPDSLLESIRRLLPKNHSNEQWTRAKEQYLFDLWSKGSFEWQDSLSFEKQKLPAIKDSFPWIGSEDAKFQILVVSEWKDRAYSLRKIKETHSFFDKKIQIFYLPSRRFSELLQVACNKSKNQFWKYIEITKKNCIPTKEDKLQALRWLQILKLIKTQDQVFTEFSSYTLDEFDYLDLQVDYFKKLSELRLNTSILSL